MKKHITFFIILIIIFPAVLFSSDKLDDISDVNMVSIGSYVHDGVLTVDFFYRNREVDKLVFWREGNVYCNCLVYASNLDGDKKEEITSGENNMTNFDQDLFIDIPPGYLGQKSWGLVECEINTGYDSFKATDRFLIK